MVYYKDGFYKTIITENGGIL